MNQFKKLILRQSKNKNTPKSNQYLELSRCKSSLMEQAKSSGLNLKF